MRSAHHTWNRVYLIVVGERCVDWVCQIKYLNYGQTISMEWVSYTLFEWNALKINTDFLFWIWNMNLIDVAASFRLFEGNFQDSCWTNVCPVRFACVQLKQINKYFQENKFSSWQPCWLMLYDRFGFVNIFAIIMLLHWLIMWSGMRKWVLLGMGYYWKLMVSQNNPNVEICLKFIVVLLHSVQQINW